MIYLINESAAWPGSEHVDVPRRSNSGAWWDTDWLLQKERKSEDETDGVPPGGARDAHPPPRQYAQRPQ